MLLTRRLLLGLFLCFVYSLTVCFGQHRSTRPAKKKVFASHPGTIREVDNDGDTKEVRLVNATDVPLAHRFFYFDRTGHKVGPTDTDVVERVPIVEVRVNRARRKKNAKPGEKGRIIEILEFGPNGRFLRSTMAARGNSQ